MLTGMHLLIKILQLFSFLMKQKKDFTIMNVWSPVLRLNAHFDSRFIGKLAATGK